MNKPTAQKTNPTPKTMTLIPQVSPGSSEHNEKTSPMHSITQMIKRTVAAQRLYAQYTQEQVDEIFYKVAVAANRARIPLAKEAVAETGMGIMEDKVIKNYFASEFI